MKSFWIRFQLIIGSKWKAFQGARGEHKIARLLRRSGYEVIFMPIAHKGFDLKVRLEQDDPWIRVQIKTTTSMSSSGLNTHLRLTRNNGTANYTNDEFDWLIALNPKTGEIWKLPYSAIKGKRKLSLLRRYRILPKPIIQL